MWRKDTPVSHANRSVVFNLSQDHNQSTLYYSFCTYARRVLTSGAENEVLEVFLGVVLFKNVFSVLVLVGRVLRQSNSEQMVNMLRNVKRVPVSFP